MKKAKAADRHHVGARAGGPHLAVATAARRVPAGCAPDDPRLYFNRELSWMDYAWRLLARAIDARLPLPDRVRALAETAGFLDEFFSKRVGGLKRQLLSSVSATGPDAYTVREQLSLVRQAAVPLYGAMAATWQQDIRPSLGRVGIPVLCDYDALSADQTTEIRRVFEQHTLPTLTPLAVDPGHPFPFISNLSQSLAVTLRHPKRGTRHFARVKIPRLQGGWMRLTGGVISLQEVVRHNLDDLFRGMDITGAYAFRVTRNADVRHNEEEADDLLTMISDHLRKRRFAPVVRLEVERSMPKNVRRLLMRHLLIGADDVYEGTVLLDPSDCLAVASLGEPECASPGYTPAVPPAFSDSHSLFDVIRSKDILLHHPYESFQESVLRFVEEAAGDARVLAIKQTLYRTSEDSLILAALMRAAKAGKQVAVHVEAKARYDEEQNLAWGQRLEDAGVSVTYGLPRLKTHAKVTLVVRREDQLTETFCHIGTGNYNSESASTHSDVGILTADPDIGADITDLFNFLTGYAPVQDFRRILVAPAGMRRAFVDLIRREADSAGYIVAAMNELDDAAIIKELYRAAAAGARVDLVVRGPCRLRPGLAGYSKNIRVVSIVGRFTENLRIFSFGAGDAAKVFIGSADWRRYHLDDRVEVAVPVQCPDVKRRLSRFLSGAVAEQHLAWELGPGGAYRHRRGPPPGLHERLMAEAAQ